MIVLLIGPTGHGGEGVYVDALEREPPPGVEYQTTRRFHEQTSFVRSDRLVEAGLNRIVRRAAIPDMGFRAVALRQPVDLVHVHAHPVRLRRRRGTPIVMSEGSSSAVYLGEYLGWTDSKLARRFRSARRIYRLLGVADRLLTLDRATRAYVFSAWAREINIRWGADPDKLDVIYPGFDLPPASPRNPADTFTFLFVGGDFERKGGFTLIEAFEQVRAAHPAARLVIAGGDPRSQNPDRLIHTWISPDRRRRALSALDRLQSAGLITCLGWMDHSRLRQEVFPAADAFVMPTHAEGFGFTNVEAMSFGLPVVTSTAGPAAELIADRQTGRLVPPGDVVALAAAMCELIEDRTVAVTMGETARRDFEARFTRARFRDRLLEFYRRALTT